MIPIRDENPSKTIPFITYGLIAANIILYLYNGPFSENGTNPLMAYLLVPKAVFTGQNDVIRNAAPPVFTLFSHMFLHANIAHIAGNMLYLWIFGNNIEDALGHFKFLIFYIICGLAAAAAQILPQPMSQVPMLGASGAIAGVLGAYMILYPKAKIITVLFFSIIVLPASAYLGIWFLYQAFNSFIAAGAGRMAGGGVAFLAHIGGFIAGIILIKIMQNRRSNSGKRRNSKYYEID